MSLTLKKFTGTRTEQNALRRIYFDAFPEEERAPFRWLLWRALKNKADWLIAYDETALVGFVYVVYHSNLAYLFYLAIEETQRGCGYGSGILQAIRRQYPDKQIFLAREPLDAEAENATERIRRHQFYLRNGFQDLPYRIKEATVWYDVMGTESYDAITPEAYKAMMTNWREFTLESVKMTPKETQ